MDLMEIEFITKLKSKCLKITSSMEKHDEALEMIDLYSSSDTNGYIHELTGDILLEQGKID